MEAVVNYQNFTNFRRKRMKLLKGNFQPKKNPELKDTEKDQSSFDENFKKKAIENIGGSMVFVERRKMTWDGD